ncbi:MAG: hypothetical protein Q8N37_01100 [bacterium]|nr:hypothetical protein [bacterium]
MMQNNFKSKLYRSIMSFFSVAENRRGECANCGACCQLPVKCLFLRFDGKGKSYCAIWKYRFLQCRKYPRTKQEWITPEKCGYSFEKNK